MLTILGTIAVVIVTIALGLVLDRRFGLFPDPKRLRAAAAPKQLGAGHEAGEAPATAIAATPGQIERIRRAQRHCRRVMDVLADSAVEYDGAVLHVLRFRCTKCRVETSVYVRPVPAS